jgi:Ice-binding-like
VRWPLHAAAAIRGGKGATKMTRSNLMSRITLGSIALLASAFVAGCGSDSPAVDPSPTSPGAGTGTGQAGGHGPAPVALASAGTYVVLAKSSITNVPTSAITGSIGLSPAAASFITGFALTLPSGGASSSSAQVSGNIYASDYAVPTPTNLTTAIGDMQTAYVDAAGRTTPDHTELAAGELGGLTLPAGLYKWSNTVTISTDVTISGGASDVWIFQIAGGVTQAAAAKVVLTGGALAKNVYWQVFGVVDIGTTALMQGVVLSQTSITLKTGASANGRLFAQTSVTLAGNAVVQE